MATVVAETSLKIKSFAKIFAIIFFIYNFRLKKITNLITGKIEIYKYIENKYGAETLKNLKYFLNNTKKFIALNADISFLTTCKHRELIPKHARVKLFKIIKI